MGTVQTTAPLLASSLCTMVTDKSQCVRKRGRKRCRSSISNTSTSMRFYFAESVVFMLSASFVLFGVYTVAQIQSSSSSPSQYNSCFDQLIRADDNLDLLLSRQEYNKFLVTISGGAVLLQNEIPRVLQLPYNIRVPSTSSTLNIGGINSSPSSDESVVIQHFCQEIYDGLISIFDIEIDTASCTAAFQSADTIPQNGKLSTNEYTFFVVNISKDVSLINSGFNELPKAMQDVYNDIQIAGEIPESYGGEDYLMNFCKRTAIAAEIGTVVYATMPTEAPSKAPISKPPTLVPTTATKVPTANPMITKCKTALIVSDKNRNALLDLGEYGKFIALLSDGKISEMASSTSIFQITYKELVDSESNISLSGYRPGTTPTPEENGKLATICNRSYSAIKNYELEEPSDTPLSTPSLSPSSTSNNSTSLTQVEFQTCTKHITLSDSNRNNVMDESEYLSFISRMTSTQDLSGYSFENLGASLQDAFTSKATAIGGIDIDGSKPSQNPTAKQEEYLKSLCKDVRDALKTNKPPKSPSHSPTVAAIQLPDDFLRVCETAMVVADLDRDNGIEVEEYVRLLNRLTISEFSGKSFIDLDPILQDGFFNVAINNVIDVYGSKPGMTPTQQESDHLHDVCASVYKALETYNNVKPNDPENENACHSALLSADLNLDSELNRTEYLKFLSEFNVTKSTSFDSLPYVLKNVFDWLSLGHHSINIDGISNSSRPIQGNEIRISWICERTMSAAIGAADLGNGANLTSHCEAAIKLADNDTDSVLNEKEYLHLLTIFAVEEWFGYNMSSIDTSLAESFKTYSDHNFVDVKKAKSNGLCEGLANATESSRDREIFLHFCISSLKMSDKDSNGRLNQTEYIPFIDNLLSAYDLPIISGGGFESLKADEGGIDIRGVYVNASMDQLSNLRHTCLTTGYAFGILNETESQNITIYNSFLIQNRIGIKAKDLIPESDERLGLEKAYSYFVDNEINTFSELQRRRLTISTLELMDTNIYQIDDRTCPDEYSPNVNCQVVFASFDVSLQSADSQPIDNINILSNRTQEAIDRGTLQLMLSTVDPENVLIVEKSSMPLQPGIDSEEPMGTVDDDDEEEIQNEETSNVGLIAIIGAAAGASMLGASLFYVFVSRNRKQNGTSPIEKSFDKEVIEVDDMIQTKGTFDSNTYSLEEGRSQISSPFVISSSVEDEDQTKDLSDSVSTFRHNEAQGFDSRFIVNDDSESSDSLQDSNNKGSHHDKDNAEVFSTYKSNLEKGNSFDFINEEDCELDDKDEKESKESGISTSAISLISKDNDTFHFTVTDSCDEFDSVGNYDLDDKYDARSSHNQIDAKRSDRSIDSKCSEVKEEDGADFDEDEYIDESYTEEEIEFDDESEAPTIKESMIDNIDPKHKPQQTEPCFDEVDESESSYIIEEEVEDEFNNEMEDDFVVTEPTAVNQNDGLGKEEQSSKVSTSEVEITNKDDLYSVYVIGAVKDTIDDEESCKDNGAYEEAEVTEVDEEETQSNSEENDDEAVNGNKSDSLSLKSDDDSEEEDDESEVAEDNDVQVEINDDNDEKVRATLRSDSPVSTSDDDSDVDDDDEEESEEDEETSESEEEESEDENSSSISDDDSIEGDDTNESSSSMDEADTLIKSAASMNHNTDVCKSTEKYRPIIEDLVRKVLPDEIDNVDAMMEQFLGNEMELVTTLRNMAGIVVVDDDIESDDASESSTSTVDDVKVVPKVESDTSEEEEDESSEEESELEDKSEESEEESEESEEDSEESEEESEESEEESDEDDDDESEESEEESSEESETGNDDDKEDESSDEDEEEDASSSSEYESD